MANRPPPIPRPARAIEERAHGRAGLDVAEARPRGDVVAACFDTAERGEPKPNTPH
jgi:hypothetical protein